MGQTLVPSQEHTLFTTPTATPTVLLLRPSLLSGGKAAPEPLQGPAKDHLIAQTLSQVLKRRAGFWSFISHPGVVNHLLLTNEQWAGWELQL